jgi:hypothetical protein
MSDTLTRFNRCLTEREISGTPTWAGARVRAAAQPRSEAKRSPAQRDFRFIELFGRAVRG